MLSLTCKTAIKAVIYLAAKYESGKKAGIKEITESINASEHTIGKVLQVLVKNKIINSTKGPAGGFYISTRQRNQAVIKIINAIDGPELFDQCGLGLSNCSSTHPCPIHEEYKVIRVQFKSMCMGKKISDLGATLDNGFAYLKDRM
jgi:Rrf2 family protein